jgi:hypothetical protein
MEVMQSVGIWLNRQRVNLHVVRDAEIVRHCAAAFMVIYCDCLHGRTQLEERIMTEPNSTGYPSSTDIARMIEQLNNAHIRWDGTLIGLVPTIVSDSARQVLASGDVVIPQLVTALDDKSKFVAAHVLLTLLSGVEYRASPWNGLAIDLSADGEVRVDPRQRFELARRWRAWEQATPRLRSLPSE